MGRIQFNQPFQRFGLVASAAETRVVFIEQQFVYRQFKILNHALLHYPVGGI